MKTHADTTYAKLPSSRDELPKGIEDGDTILVAADELEEGYEAHHVFKGFDEHDKPKFEPLGLITPSKRAAALRKFDVRGIATKDRIRDYAEHLQRQRDKRAAWLKEHGLAINEDGFVCVAEKLQPAEEKTPEAIAAAADRYAKLESPQERCESFQACPDWVLPRDKKIDLAEGEKMFDDLIAPRAKNGASDKEQPDNPHDLYGLAGAPMPATPADPT